MPIVLARDSDALRRNLGRLAWLRGLLIVAIVLGGLLAGLLYGAALLADPVVLGAIGMLTGFNLWTVWRLRRGRPVQELTLFGQMLLDVLVMTVVLYRTGGATNPFVFGFLVPLTIAAATLRVGFSVVLALLTLGAYTLLLFQYQPFAPFAGASPAQHAGHGDHSAHVLALETDDPHAHHRMVMTATPPTAGFDLHIFGMWLNFLLSAGLITFFVSRMSGALREQDRRLAEQQEHLLQREQVVALGALAAGAAHELGTPLATMTVLAADIEQDLPADSPLRADMQLLRRQLGLCRDILHGLREQAGGLPRQMMLADFLGEAVARMELLHPGRRFRIDGELPERALQVPAVLPQVLGNLLDNAAQAARAEVRLACHDEAGECRIDISDDGPGIAPGIAERLGQPFVSNKADGLGIGYFLSHASLTPLGGRIEIEALKQGGTRTRLCLPWTALAVAEGA